MKKFLLSSIVFAAVSFSANAQDSASSNVANTMPSTVNKDGAKPQGRYEKWKNASTEDKVKMADERAKKWESMSEEEKKKMMENNKGERMGEKNNMGRNMPQNQNAGQNNFGGNGNAQMPQNNMDSKRREVMEKLTEDQRKAFKAEMERHRQAIKQITGVDLVPAMPEGGPQAGQNRDGGNMPQNMGDMRNGGGDMPQDGDKMKRGSRMFQGGDKMKRNPNKMPQGEEESQEQSNQ